MLRITASIGTFLASQTDTVLVSAVADLLDFVSSVVSLHPTAITLVESPPADLTVTQVVLRSTKNPDEVAHRIYKGPAVPISSVLGAFGRDALKSAQLTPLHFIADHGMEIVFTYSNGTTALDATLLWDVQNQKPMHLPVPLGWDQELAAPTGLKQAQDAYWDYAQQHPDAPRAQWSPFGFKHPSGVAVHDQIRSTDPNAVYNPFTETWVKSDDPDPSKVRPA